MSVKIMGQVWDLELPHAHMLVLLSLADHADHQGGSVYPGTGLVAWKCGYSVRQTQRVMDELVAMGLLVEVENKPGKRPVYRIDLSAGKQKAPYRGRQNVTPVKKSPVTFTTEGGDILSNGGVTFAQDEKPPNEAIETPKTPQKSRANHHVEPSIKPPPTQERNQTPIGGGGKPKQEPPTETEQYLLDEGFIASTAYEFRNLDLAACRRSVKQFRAKGTHEGGMVNHWRRSPPKPIAPAAYATPVEPPADTLSRDEILARMTQHRRPA